MLSLHVQLRKSTLRGVIKRLRFLLEVMLVCARCGQDIELRQSRYLNNLVEQDRRGAIKRRTRSMMGFGRFHTAAKLIADFETMHMIKKGQLRCHQDLVVSDADRSCSLATR